MSDSYDPTRASGVPTPPAGSPPVGGPGTGATPGAEPPPTVASSSIYTDPPATAYGAGGPTVPGGPTGPGGPGDGSGEDWGPEGEPDDRWKIYALVGLAIVVIALLIGGIVLSQSGDDGDDPPATTSSTSSSTTSSSTTTSSTSTSTTTTTAPTTTTAAPTTTTDAGPPGAASPEAAAASLYNAWTAGDQANAGQFADPGAVTTIFERDGRGNDLSFEGCSSTGASFDCTYSSDLETLVLEVDEVPRGFRVTGASFPGD